MLAHHNSALRAIDIAISFVDREEQRLRAVIESDSISGDDRFQALQDLAYLSGVVVRELADIDSGSAGPDHIAERAADGAAKAAAMRSEEHTSELQSLRHLVCRLLLEK